jgi:hypothetical protein
LSGLGEAITSVFPDTVVQTCVVHYADHRIMPMWSPFPLVVVVPELKMSA